MTNSLKANEVLNPSIPDMFLEDQIEAGCNDWRVDLPGGSVHFGHTEEEAMENALRYECRYGKRS